MLTGWFLATLLDVAMVAVGVVVRCFVDANLCLRSSSTSILFAFILDSVPFDPSAAWERCVGNIHAGEVSCNYLADCELLT